MEIIITNWVNKKYPDAVKKLITLLENCMDNKSFAITKATGSYTRIEIRMKNCDKSVLAYTIKIHTNLSESAKKQVLDIKIPLENFKDECGKFFQEAIALRNIVEMKRPFGLNVICVSYLSPTQ